MVYPEGKGCEDTGHTPKDFINEDLPLKEATLLMQEGQKSSSSNGKGKALAVPFTKTKKSSSSFEKEGSSRLKIHRTCHVRYSQ